MQALTEDQQHEMRQQGELRLVDPQTRQEYIAVKVEIYDRLKHLIYDSSKWTDDELEAIAARTFDELDNPEMVL